MKQLLGNRVLLEFPPKEQSKIIVDENTKEALQKKLMEKMSKLKVYSVGDTVQTIKKGDIVLVDPEALQKAKIVPLEDREVMLVSYFDIVMVW